jgi:hypothetical protein
VEALRRAYTREHLDLSGGSEHLRDATQWHAFVDALVETDWVVYAKPAFGGASAVLRYLGSYTHAWRSVTTGCSPSMAPTSPSSGRTTPMATSAAR